MAMPVPAAHFSHPQHEIKLREYHLSRRCDLCQEKLTGSGYSCDHLLCDFDLHEECASYPETLRSFYAHPCHRLVLSRIDGPRRVCDLCCEEVPAGVFLYRCPPCGFDVHPRCSRLPQTVRSELHPNHVLTALPDVGTCAACREPCDVWVYRCGLCNFDLHIECLQGARATTSTTCGSGSSKEEEESLEDKFLEGLVEAAGESLMNMFLNQ